MAEIEKHLVPEPRIQKVQHGVLRPANVKIDRRPPVSAAHPVAFGLFSDEPRLVSRIAKTQVIPTGTGPLRHGVGLARRFVGVANPFFRFRQRRFAGAGRFVIFKFRRNERQFAFV